MWTKVYKASSWPFDHKMDNPDQTRKNNGIINGNNKCSTWNILFQYLIDNILYLLCNINKESVMKNKTSER